MAAPETITEAAIGQQFDIDLEALLALARERLSQEPIAKLEQIRTDVMPITIIVQRILQNNEAITKEIKGINRQEMSGNSGQKVVYLADWDSNDGTHHSLEFVVESASPTGKIVLESYVPDKNIKQYKMCHGNAEPPAGKEIVFTKLTPMLDLPLAQSEIELDEKTVATQADFKQVFLRDDDDAKFQMPHSSPDLNAWADFSLPLALHEVDFNFGPRAWTLSPPSDNPLNAARKAASFLGDALGQYDYFNGKRDENLENVETKDSQT